MKLTMISDFNPRVSWKKDLADAIESIGWEVDRIQADRSHSDEIYESSQTSDVFLWARTHGDCPRGDMYKCIENMKYDGVKTVSLHQDAYWDFSDRVIEVGNAPFWKSEWVFTGDPVKRGWDKRGVNHKYMSCGTGGLMAKQGSFQEKYKSDIVFFGMTNGWPGGRGRKDHLEWLSGTYGDKFSMWGRSTPNGSIYEPKLNDLIASSKLVFSYSANVKGNAQGWSNRVENTIAQGGLLIHPEKDFFAQEGYIDGETILTFKPYDFDSLKLIIDNVLENSENYDKVRLAGKNMVLSRHTWDKKVMQIFKEIGIN